MTKQKKLTTKQKLFANYLSIGKSAYDAALLAGYSKSFAKGKAGKLEKKPHIQDYIQTITSNQADQNNITRNHLTKVILTAIDSAKTVSIITGQQDAKAQIQGALALARMYGLLAPEVKAEYKQSILTIEFK